METIDLLSYSLLATGYSRTADTIDNSYATDTGNDQFPNLATLTNLAAMQIGLDARVVFAIESMESSFGLGLPSGDTDIMQACGNSTSTCPTVMSALITGCQTLRSKLSSEGTYPLAASYYNCGVAENSSGDIVAECSGTTISPYGAAVIFLAFQQQFSGTLANGYAGFMPSGSGTDATANVMQTAGNDGSCASPGNLCGNANFEFGGGCMQISQMS